MLAATLVFNWLLDLQLPLLSLSDKGEKVSQSNLASDSTDTNASCVVDKNGGTGGSSPSSGGSTDVELKEVQRRTSLSSSDSRV